MVRVRVDAFEPAAGRYAFSSDGLVTSRHAHPATEQLRATAGVFDVAYADHVERGLTAATIAPNVPHAVLAPDASLDIELLDLGFGEEGARLEPRVAAVLSATRGTPASVAPTPAVLAKAVYRSESRLRHLFRAETGGSPADFLRYERLKRAMTAQLREGSALGAVAHAHDFFDAAHIARTFRKFFGVAPSLGYGSRSVQGGS